MTHDQVQKLLFISMLLTVAMSVGVVIAAAT